MPNFDGGHYFLTALIPVRTGLCADPLTTATVTSHAHELRATLGAMPTALQTPATERIGINSPFARSDRTHFARFAIIDDVAFNGRGQRDPIRVALLGPEPSVHDPVDRLHCAYLLFVADFDAASGAESELAGYLTHLWSVMETELREMLQHCDGYDLLDGPQGFVRVIRACQVETTMPFNDYWPGAPPLAPVPLAPLLAPVGVVLAALVLGLIGALAAALAGWSTRGWLILALVGLVALPLAVWWAYRSVMTKGAAPFPAAPRSDLRSVLKALYLQQQFTRFAIAMQGRDPVALHAAFASFLREHRPDDVAAPTQPRGVVRS